MVTLTAALQGKIRTITQDKSDNTTQDSKTFVYMHREKLLAAGLFHREFHKYHRKSRSRYAYFEPWLSNRGELVNGSKTVLMGKMF